MYIKIKRDPFSHRYNTELLEAQPNALLGYEKYFFTEQNTTFFTRNEKCKNRTTKQAALQDDVDLKKISQLRNRFSDSCEMKKAMLHVLE